VLKGRRETRRGGGREKPREESPSRRGVYYRGAKRGYEMKTQKKKQKKQGERWNLKQQRGEEGGRSKNISGKG